MADLPLFRLCHFHSEWPQKHELANKHYEAILFSHLCTRYNWSVRELKRQIDKQKSEATIFSLYSRC